MKQFGKRKMKKQFLLIYYGKLSSLPTQSKICEILASTDYSAEITKKYDE